MTLQYHNDTRRPILRNTYSLAGSELYLIKRELWNYDDRGNRTSAITQDYIAGTDEIYQSKGDSVKFEYDSNDRAVKRTMYKFDNLFGNWTADLSQVYAYSGDKLNYVFINQLEEGSVEIPHYRISDIFGMDEDCDEYDYTNAQLFIISLLTNDEWQPSEKHENIRDNNGHTKIKSLWDGSDFIPLDKTEYKNFHSQVYRRIRNIFTWINRESLTDITQSKFLEDEGRFKVISASRNLMQLSINAPISKSGNNSASEGDSLMTLIHQFYDPGTDEWYDQGNKFEIVFRNTSTSIADEFDGDNNIVVYPNPSNGVLNVQINNIKEISRIDIVNSIGQTVSAAHFDNFSGNYNYQTDLKHLEKGIYVINVYSENNVFTRKFILL